MLVTPKRIIGMLLFIALLLSSMDGLDPVEGIDCSMGSSSCDSCHAAHPFCYWCDANSEGNQCLRYYDDNFAKLECPSGYRFQSCADSSQKAKLDKMLKLLLELKKNRQGAFSNTNENTGLGGGYVEPTKSTSLLGSYLNEGARSSRIQRIMKLLKVLRLIQEKNNYEPEHGYSNEREHTSVDSHNRMNTYQAESNTAKSKATKPNLSKSASNSDLDSLLKLVAEMKTTMSPTTHGSNNDKKSTENKKGKHLSLVKQLATAKDISNSVKHVETSTEKPTRLQHKVSSTVMLYNNIVGPVHTNNTRPKSKSSERVVKTLSNKTLSADRLKTTKSKYCVVYEEEDNCNSDQNCSWCNILSECIGRTTNDYQYCFENNKRSSEKHYNVDPCMENTVCSSCTKGGKCYWCEKTKSCHTYPFFGFVPHNCPANQWYYKECDVQLAIFIILFPLIIILIALVVFYFCLRYCYYRKRVLKVPLFEKTGLYEKKQGKKVYFMGADDEDEEIRSEQIRKKYKLPAEKEPLIAP